MVSSINEVIKSQASALEGYVIQARRTLHAIAETSSTEFRTHAFIAGELGKLGLPYETVADTGLIATLDTGRPGPSVALRADIDALPIPESPDNLKGPRVCVSSQPNTCHACGHDGHTSMLLGSIRILCGMKEQLRGILYFCFEEGEENGKGSPAMIATLKERHVDAAWAIHVYAGLDSGKICVDAGPRMAGGASVDITVKGKGGHGSRPDLSINPVFPAAAIVTAIPGVFANQLDPTKTVTFGITTIQGGGAANVFSDTATIAGTLRFFDMEEGRKALDIVKNVAEHTAAMHRCAVEYGQRMMIFGGPVINDAKYAALAKESLAQVLPEGAVSPCEPWYASESFGRYLTEFPGVLALLGIRNPEKGTGASHHSSLFDIDEDVLKLGVMSTVRYALSALDED